MDEYGNRLSTDRLSQQLQRARAAGVVRAERRGRAFFYSAPPAAPPTPPGGGQRVTAG